MPKILLLFLSLLLLLPNFFSTDIHSSLAYSGKEKFNPGLSYINTTQKLEQFVDSLAAVRHISADTFATIALLDSVIEYRFYHGFSHFTLHENWMAALCGKLFKEDFACKVYPEDIMQQTNAACSQQSIVMMQILRNKNIPYHSVGFPHHYALEAKTGSNWYFLMPIWNPL